LTNEGRKGVWNTYQGTSSKSSTHLKIGNTSIIGLSGNRWRFTGQILVTERAIDDPVELIVKTGISLDIGLIVGKRLSRDPIGGIVISGEEIENPHVKLQFGKKPLRVIQPGIQSHIIA
jgi:hypothetical protein